MATKPMTLRRETALLLTCATFVGCASTHTPSEPGRVAITMETGGPTLMKDGKRYGMLFSNGPVEAVAGVPAAEEHARTYVRRTRTGLLLEALALGSLATAIAVVPRESGHDTRRDVAQGALVGGLALVVAAAVVIMTAPGHLYDAINIYNDEAAKAGK